MKLFVVNDLVWRSTEAGMYGVGCGGLIPSVTHNKFAPRLMLIFSCTKTLPLINELN